MAVGSGVVSPVAWLSCADAAEIGTMPMISVMQRRIEINLLVGVFTSITVSSYQFADALWQHDSLAARSVSLPLFPHFSINKECGVA